MTIHETLDTALRRLEASMKATDIWGMSPPEPQAYASQQPFCIDTMELPQWLRFVFIPRLDALIEAKGRLPEKCDVAPVVDTYLEQKGVRAADRLLVGKAVEEIDRLISEN